MMNQVKKIGALILLVTSVCLSVQAQLVAFPGAEGFGKFATGGRGGQVVYVTSLEDDANGAIPGTLRWAIQQYPGEPLTVCFAVSGEIRLVKDLRFNRRENFTLAGQTAPGLGIVITHNKVNFGGSNNFIVRNLRFRVGVEDANGNALYQNAVGAENCSNYIFDHCDFGWSGEENMNSYDSHFITIQYCIVHEGLCNSGHPKGARGYGCQWGGSPASFHHNLLVNNDKRSCRFNGGGENDKVVYEDYINNVVYNYGAGSNGCYGGENTAKIAEYNGKNAAHEVNFINNYYKPGPNTTNSTKLFVMASYARSGTTSWGPAQWHLEGNVMEGVAATTADNSKGFKSEKTYTAEQMLVDTIIRPVLNYYEWVSTNPETGLDSVKGLYDFDTYAYAAADYQSAAEAYETVLDTVGCWPRDRVEVRLIKDTRDGTYTFAGSVSKKKGIIDRPEDAEGFYTYPQAEVLVDTDLDGMPDEWETANGCNPEVADQNTLHTSGYTMLEMYLDYAMSHRPSLEDIDTANPMVTSSVKPRKEVIDGTLYIEHNGKKINVLGI